MRSVLQLYHGALHTHTPREYQQFSCAHSWTPGLHLHGTQSVHDSTASGQERGGAGDAGAGVCSPSVLSEVVEAMPPRPETGTEAEIVVDAPLR